MDIADNEGMRWRGALMLAVLAMSAIGFGQAQRPVRNPVPSGKGAISGRVIDAATKRPLARARVRLQPRGRYAEWAPGIEADPARQVTTGASGEFKFTDLGPIEYDLTASRAGYSESGAGKTWARGSYAPIQVSQDQTISAVEILLWPMGELIGRVVDERGLPVAGVPVRAVNPDLGDDSPDSGRHVGAGNTDERGEYRFAVQPPGHAIVCVDAYYTTYAIPALAPNQRRLTNASPFGAFGVAPSMLIAPDGRHFVQFNLLPPPTAPNGYAEAYVRTCAPAATSSSEAASVELKSGSTAVPDLILQPRRSIRISGRLVGPGGPLGQTWLRLLPRGDDRFAPPYSARALTAIDGTFSFLIVPQGSYRWEVNVPDPPPTVTPSASGFPALYSPDYGTVDTNGYWIADPQDAGGGDINDLTLVARRGVTVSGTIIFDGPAPSKGQRGPFITLKGPRELFGGRMSEVTEGGKFEIEGVKPGSYGLDAYVPGFSIVEMSKGTSDLIDGPLVVGEEGVSDVVVRVSSQPAIISGVVRTTNGSMVSSPTVVIFPVDSRAWKTYGRQLRIRSMRGVAGRYEFAGLPPGDYRVAAIDDSLMARWLDPALFASLEPSAQRVALQSGQQLTINLVKR